MVAAFLIAFMAPPLATAGDVKPWNLPIIGAGFAVVEMPVSFVKNVVSCKGFEDCINLPKQAGKAVLNGAERIVGTSTLGFAGAYNRDLAVNGPLAQNKFLSNAVGWGGTLYGLSFIPAAHVAHHFTHTVLGLHRHTAALAVGTAGGLAIGGIETAVAGTMTDK